MGDPPRGDESEREAAPVFPTAFDVGYRILGDVGAAEDCATEAMARARARWQTVDNVPDRQAWVLREAAGLAMAMARRSADASVPGEDLRAAEGAEDSSRRLRRGAAVLAGTALVLFAVAAGTAIARSGGNSKRVVHSAGGEAVGTAADEPTTTEPTTSTTAVLLQPPIATPPPSTDATPPPSADATPATAAVGAAATRAPAPPATPVTAAPAETLLQPQATLAEVFPPSRDPLRVYISARAQDAHGYVSRMAIDWGDGTAAANFEYPLAACRTGQLQAADTNHAYAAPGTYTVRLIVTSVSCDGRGAQSVATQATLTYPSSPASG
ncbi:MAG: hypothetical protein JOZ04_15680 [Acidimicrobiia bacterium]|nr:hypothetical protein [Acidimicrobiia bacterium]